MTVYLFLAFQSSFFLLLVHGLASKCLSNLLTDEMHTILESSPKNISSSNISDSNIIYLANTQQTEPITCPSSSATTDSRDYNQDTGAQINGQEQDQSKF